MRKGSTVKGGFEKRFCRECGAHLFSRDPDDDARVSLGMSAFHGDPGVRPTVRVHVAYRRVGADSR